MTPRHATLVGLLFVFFSGCVAEPITPPLYPLTVTVVQNGKTVKVGGLIFMPESGDWGGRVVNASPNSDGIFSAQTSRATGTATTIQPGIPAGRYKVAYHPVSDGQKVGLEYEFPDSIAIEERDNTLWLLLPARFPGEQPKQKVEETIPADDR